VPRMSSPVILPSTVVWEAILPALGFALVLGASLLPAVAIAAIAMVASYGLLGRAG
jgi:hypothetical protein